jgi:isoleucyl-tRNA synthetase
VAGFDDLAHRTGLDVDQIDPHRPAVDRLTFSCTACGGTMRRVAAVVDAAFEAAVLPSAGATRSPMADLAVGLGNGHVGWLGDLTELVALLQGELAWERAVALESEAEPSWSEHQSPSADALRWAVYMGTTPQQAMHDLMYPLWQLFFGGAEERAPSALPVCQSESGLSLLDRWLLARLHQAVALVTEALEACDQRRAAEALGTFVRDLCVRYATRRPGGTSKGWATLSQLLAPFTPHLAEAISRLVEGKIAGSVHLTAWPTPNPAQADRDLLAAMALVWQLADLGQAARVQIGIPSQSLYPALVGLLSNYDRYSVLLNSFRPLLAELLGVSEVHLTPFAAEGVEWQLSLNRDRAMDRSFAPAEIDAELADLDPEAAMDLASQVWRGLSVGLEAASGAITLLPDEVHVSVQPQPGWAVATDNQAVVALRVD